MLYAWLHIILKYNMIQNSLYYVIFHTELIYNPSREQGLKFLKHVLLEGRIINRNEKDKCLKRTFEERMVKYWNKIEILEIQNEILEIKDMKISQQR